MNSTSDVDCCNTGLSVKAWSRGIAVVCVCVCVCVCARARVCALSEVADNKGIGVAVAVLWLRCCGCGASASAVACWYLKDLLRLNTGLGSIKHCMGSIKA